MLFVTEQHRLFTRFDQVCLLIYDMRDSNNLSGKHDSIDVNFENNLKIFLEEYKKHSSEILKRVEFHQNNIKMQLVIIAAIIAGSIQFILKGVDIYLLILFFLVSPLPIYFLSWSYSNNDIMIIANAIYLEKRGYQIKKELLGTNALSWEKFLKKYRNTRATELPNSLLIGEEYLLPLIFPIILNLLSFVFLIYIFATFDYLSVVNIIPEKVTFKKLIDLFTQIVSQRQLQKIIAVIGDIFLLILNIELVFYTIRTKISTGKAYSCIVDIDI